MQEPYDQQMKDSDNIFSVLTTSAFKTEKEALQALVIMYIPDLTYSRSGISHAEKRIKQHFKDKT